MTYQKITVKRLINTGIEREIQIPLSPLGENQKKLKRCKTQCLQRFLFLGIFKTGH